MMESAHAPRDDHDLRDCGTAGSPPFSSMVGQLSLRAALLLNVVEPLIGGILIRGEPGTGKSTAVRSLRSLLPPIDVVSDCAFNCDPADPALLCASCRQRQTRDGQLPFVQRRVPLVTLPLGATEDRLLGTLDLEAALQDGRRRLSPGVLAEVNRGFLYLDEVNLAADHLLDAMLDAASSGVHRIERDGVSATHAARFSLIGTMNPGEGGLRPQILDRFGLSVDAEAIRDPRLRVRVLTRRLELERSPDERRRYESLDRDLADRIVEARKLLPSVTCRSGLLADIGGLTAELGVASHRADLVILRASIACAALGLRTEVTSRDVALAAVLALKHRTGDHSELLAAVSARLLPDGPFRSQDDLLRSGGEPWQTLSAAGDDPVGDGDGSGHDHPRRESAGTDPPGRPDGSVGGGCGPRAGPHHVGANGDAAPRIGPAEPRTGNARLATPLKFNGHRAQPADMLRTPRGSTAPTLVLEAEGRTGGSPAHTWRTPHGRVAMVPTVIAATLRLLSTGVGPTRLLPLRPQPSDIVRTARTGRPNVAVVVVLDASWSMAMDGTFARARALLAGLLDTTRRGDRTALIVVGGDRARVAVPFSRRVEPVVDLVMALRPRGRTPLIDGIQCALSMCANRWAFTGCATPLVLVVTDGRDNQRAETPADRARASRLATTSRYLRVPGSILALSGESETASVRRVAHHLGWQIRELGPGDGA